MLAHRLADVDGLEAISQDAEMRRIFLRLSAMSRRGALPDRRSDHAFLLAVEEYLRGTHRRH